MRRILICLCLAVPFFLNSFSAEAAGSELSAQAKAEMAREVARGGSELMTCADGKNSDRQIADCLQAVLSANIGAETDTLPFLVGAYFAAWAKLINSEPSAGVKEKWLGVSFKRFSEMQGESGLSDREICEAAGIPYSVGVQDALARMRK